MNHKVYKKVVLIILDGFGVAPVGHGNAISQAQIPTLNFLVSNFPSLTLQASGPLVGLPWGEMGNSEVGHLNIGAGRIVGQDLPRITTAIQNGTFFKNPVLLEAIDHAKKNNASLHLMGLVSPGGVHSFDEHLYALLSLAKDKGQKKVFIHMFTDGRDTEPKVALESLKKLSDKIAELGVGRVATVTGRFYAMDRGGHWGQTKKTYEALVEGKGQTAQSPEQAVSNSYRAQIFDEMIEPTVVVGPDNQPLAKIGDNDAVIFFNFRSDRAIQLSQNFISPESLPVEFRPASPDPLRQQSEASERASRGGPQPLQNLYFATMTEYAPSSPAHVVFGHEDLKNNLAEVLSNSKLTQFHMAESEKYAHVTSFFNCGRTELYPGEERQIVTSPENNARNYVDHPEMSAEKLTDSLTQKIQAGATNFFVVNYANPDMVGHTGNLQAGILAVSFIDRCLKKVLDACLQQDAVLIVTADHGNCEQMINPKTGDIDKDHTTNPVPFLLAANEFKYPKALARDYFTLAPRVPAGLISDIAPTILELLGLPKPLEMTGISLLEVIDEVPVKLVSGIRS